jgi:peptide/nickel transport system substrate-binding protein
MYALIWVGSNEDPDIFRYAYGSDRVPPRGANRGHYANAEVDRLLASAAATNDEATRRTAYVAVQKILLEDAPGVVLWYPQNEVVHARRLMGVTAPASGSFDFLRSAWLQ